MCAGPARSCDLVGSPLMVCPVQTGFCNRGSGGLHADRRPRVKDQSCCCESKSQRGHYLESATQAWTSIFRRGPLKLPGGVILPPRAVSTLVTRVPHNLERYCVGGLRDVPAPKCQVSVSSHLTAAAASQFKFNTRAAAPSRSIKQAKIN